MSYKKREHSHGAVLSFWKWSICRTKYRNRTAGWVKGEKKWDVFFEEKCAVEEASVYLYFPTLVRCDKEKEKTSCSKSVKVPMWRKQNKVKVKQKIFHSWTVNVPRRIWNLWVYTDRMYETGTEPPCDSSIATKTNSPTSNALLTQAHFSGASKHLQAAPKFRGGCPQRMRQLRLGGRAGGGWGQGPAHSWGRASPAALAAHPPCPVRCRRTRFVTWRPIRAPGSPGVAKSEPSVPRSPCPGGSCKRAAAAAPPARSRRGVCAQILPKEAISAEKRGNKPSHKTPIKLLTSRSIFWPCARPRVAQTIYFVSEGATWSWFCK